jgi:hypothetical protein
MGCDGSAVHPSVFSVLSEDVQCKYKRFTALDLAQVRMLTALQLIVYVIILVFRQSSVGVE